MARVGVPAYLGGEAVGGIVGVVTLTAYSVRPFLIDGLLRLRRPGSRLGGKRGYPLHLV